MDTLFAGFQGQLLDWYDRERRRLPWRPDFGAPADNRPDPYHVMVSEVMLQQTQVATVVPYFRRFLARFPTLSDLAMAEEQEVLRLWQGLGYYRRARLLWATAKMVVKRYDGKIPRQLADLRALPGVGRYTAGAIASLAFDEPAAIVDGNVARVLCRLHGIRSEAEASTTRGRLWKLAERMVPEKRAGDFNSALMELGATVCTPRNPQCQACPVGEECKARKTGRQHAIPRAKRRAAKAMERRWVLCAERAGRYLIEQRPAEGRWGGMWQFVTVVAGTPEPTAEEVGRWTGYGIGEVRKLGTIRHELTHRRYEFEVYKCRVVGRGRAKEGRRWVRLVEMDGYAMSRPQVQARAMLEEGVRRGGP